MLISDIWVKIIIIVINVSLVFRKEKKMLDRVISGIFSDSFHDLIFEASTLDLKDNEDSE